MEALTLGNSNVASSRLAYGCMRIAGDGSTAGRKSGKRALQTAVECGYSLFDHADIYGEGACESLFGEFLYENPGIRDHLVIVSKCGIRLDPKRYDFRAPYLTSAVEGSLGRMGIDQLDLLLLHRPDYLMNADEVASAFDSLRASGKVAHFGVSNFSASQLDLLQSRVSVPLLVNQVEINIHNVQSLDDGTLDQCQRLGITPQAWCPLGGIAYPAWGNTLTAADERRIRDELDRQSKHYGVDDWLIVLAWLLIHPARISPILGSTTPLRIRAATQALEIKYQRDDWYQLLEARRGHPAA